MHTVEGTKELWQRRGGCTMKSPESDAVSWCIARFYTFHWFTIKCRIQPDTQYNQIHSTTKDTIQMQPEVNTEAPSAASCAFHRGSVSLLCTEVHWLWTPAFDTLWSVSYTFCHAIHPSYFLETSNIFLCYPCFLSKSKWPVFAAHYDFFLGGKYSSILKYSGILYNYCYYYYSSIHLVAG